MTTTKTQKITVTVAGKSFSVDHNYSEDDIANNPAALAEELRRAADQIATGLVNHVVPQEEYDRKADPSDPYSGRDVQDEQDDLNDRKGNERKNSSNNASTGQR